MNAVCDIFILINQYNITQQKTNTKRQTATRSYIVWQLFSG